MITPKDVQNYTVFQDVRDRLPELLEFDIVQGSADIFNFVGHDFTGKEYRDEEGNPALPKSVKLAFIKVSEYYALINSDESIAKGYKSEKIGDYSYQIGEGEVKTLSLSSLLAGHIKKTSEKGVTLRMGLL